MTSLAAAIVLASMLAQPPAPPATPSAPAPVAQPAAPAAPAPAAASAATAGPWVVGEPKFYRVEESTEDLSFLLASPEKKNERKTTAGYIVRLIPRTLDAGKQTFELAIVELKIAAPTPIGEMKYDSTAKEAPKDQVSVHFGSVVKQMLGVPVTISIADGKVTDVKGNEALADSKSPASGIISAFFSDAALTERFAWCVATGAPVKIEPAATWPVDTKADFRKIMTIDLPATATVKSVKDGLATITIAPREGAKITAVAALDAAGKPDGTVKENLNAGELVWNLAESRLVSGTYTFGHTVTFDTGKAQGQQRSVRTFKASRADAPAAK